MIKKEKRKSDLQMLKEICFQVSWHFYKEPEKARFWFKTRNPHLGNATPDQLIKMGRIKKLWQFFKVAERVIFRD